MTRGPRAGIGIGKRLTLVALFLVAVGVALILVLAGDSVSGLHLVFDAMVFYVFYSMKPPV